MADTSENGLERTLRGANRSEESDRDGRAELFESRDNMDLVCVCRTSFITRVFWGRNDRPGHAYFFEKRIKKAKFR
jgi:hypothetical protein